MSNEEQDSKIINFEEMKKMSTNQKNAKVERAIKRREERIENKMKNRLYKYAEVEAFVKSSINKYKENLYLQIPVCMANVLEKEPYDFSRNGICDVIQETFDTLDKLNKEEISSEELLTVASKHGVTIVKEGNSVKIKLTKDDSQE